MYIRDNLKGIKWKYIDNRHLQLHVHNCRTTTSLLLYVVDVNQRKEVYIIDGILIRMYD